jgi:hypothetical protein
MQTRLLITIYLLAISILSGYAQPGYQGKKLSVNAGMLLMPALVNATYNKAPGYTSLNLTKEANIDYVISRRNTIGLVYKNTRTSILRNYEDDNTKVPDGKVFSNALGIQYRIFKKRSGNLAPLGKYTQLGLHMMFNRTENSKYPDAGTSFTTYAVSIGKGRSKILFNRLVFNYGLEFTHIFTGFSKEGFLGATYYYADDAHTMAQYRLWRHSVVNFKTGIGFLAL